MYFTCAAAKFQQRLLYDEAQQVYTLTMSYDDTRAMPKGHWTYDITVEFLDTKRSTVTYNGSLDVFPKNNPVDYEEG